VVCPADEADPPFASAGRSERPDEPPDERPRSAPFSPDEVCCFFDDGTKS
jgi:hypothetical protein